MAPGFVKRNEKLLMVLLLTLIAPSFAFTGVMSWYFSYKGGAPLYEVFGETIGREDFRKLRQKMANYQKITLLRQWGPYGLTAWEGGATGEATLRHLMYTREAARLGITVGDDEGKELLRDAALDIIAWHQVMEESGWQGQFFDIYQKYQQRRPTVRLFLADYQAALQDRRFRLGMSVKQFEDILVENLIVEKLLGLVQEAAEVSEREIYDEYFTAEQKRAFDIVVVPVEHFVDEAQGAIDADYLQQVYEKKESELLIKPRLKLAVAKAKRNAFYAEIEEPAEEEILARYENDKMTRYRKRRPLPPPGDDPAAAAAPDEPRPLEEVRGLVIADLKRERARARETEALEEALARARDLDAEGKEWSLSEVVAGSPDKIEVIDIDWINENQLGVVDQRIRNPASLRHLFRSFGQRRVGEPGPAVVKVPSGDYIYQVTGVEDARVPLLEECIEKVTEMAGMEKGRELALELLEDWKRRIEAEEATLESLAGAGNYTIRTTEPLGRRENAKLKFDDKPLSLIVARPILQAGFEIGTPGWLAEPISQEGQNEAYLVRLKEIHPPEMDLYESRRFQLESTILQRKRTALLNEYNRDLTKRADPRVFSAPVSDDG